MRFVIKNQPIIDKIHEAKQHFEERNLEVDCIYLTLSEMHQLRDELEKLAKPFLDPKSQTPPTKVLMRREDGKKFVTKIQFDGTIESMMFEGILIQLEPARGKGYWVEDGVDIVSELLQ